MANTEVGSAYLTIVPSMTGFADELSEGVEDAVSGLGSNLTTALTAAVTAAVTAVAAITTAAVEAYADYEQLVGGVEKLFSDSADTLQEYAQAAYQTAGLSANDYMEQVTSFSASLISSLDGDTATAVEYANLAIEDMADNANTFGTSIEDIQNAYQGFAKENYTMLDNLKLGYGGTKEEMERLIEDANELKEAQGEVGDLTIDSYADIVEAIHLVQEEMGITGTTANEAATTISGSISTAKAAWTNWLVALGDEELDIEEYTQTLLQSVDTVVENVAPRVATILDTLGTALLEGIPGIIDSLVSAISSFAPSLLSAAITLLSAIGEAIVTYLPEALSALADGLSQLAQLLIDNGPEMLAGAAEFISQIGAAFYEYMPEILGALGEILASLVAAIIANAPEFLSGASDLMLSFIDGIVAMAGGVVSALLEILADMVADILGFNGTFSSDGGQLMSSLASGVSAKASTVLSSVMTALATGISYITGLPSTALSWGKNIVSGIANGLSGAVSSVTSAMSRVKTAVTNAVSNASSWLTSAGTNIIKGLVNSIKNGLSSVTSAIKNVCKNAISAAKKALGISSPSKVFAEVGEFTMAGMAEGITGTADAVQDALDESIGGLSVDTSITTGLAVSDVSATGSSAPTAEEIADALLSALTESGLGVYLNGSTLVGELAPGMSRELGYLTMMGVA